MLKQLLYKNSPYLFFIKFLSCFFILYLFFPFYQGITEAGGKLYSPFLERHLNLIKGFTIFLTKSSRLILEALHYQVYQPYYNTLRIGYSGTRVNPSCLGWAVMSFWVAFVFANNGCLNHKLKWIFSGIASICALNIIRIVLITLAGHLQWKTITSLDHHQTFNVFAYGCIFILMYWYVRNQKKYDANKLKQKQQKNILHTI